MPTWGEVLKELQQVSQANQAQKRPGSSVQSPFDVVRRKYLERVSSITGRPVILYATAWTQGKAGTLDPDLVSIVAEDIQGLMEVMHGVAGGKLDIILHSPGGSPEAAESIVSYLRSKFTDVRIFVPHAAMSAATMLACSANRIVMGKHSYLGPIDPQFIIQTELGRRMVPAHAILEQFELAKKECAASQSALPAWLPMLRQYGPALLVQCTLARKLAESLVSQWLEKYMRTEPDGVNISGPAIAAQLADHSKFMSHSRFIDRADAKNLGLLVMDLEADQFLQDAVLSVFHAASHTFNGTPCVKIIENHLGKAFIKQQQILTIQQQQVVAPLPASPVPPSVPPTRP